MKSFSILMKSMVLSVLLLAGAAFAADKVDINTADAAQLEQVLIGVGPAKAAAIVEHRQANGPFKSADELALVQGIGLKTVERNRDLIAIGNAPTPQARPSAASGAAQAKPVAPVVRR